MSTNDIGREDHLPNAPDDWIVAYEEHVVRGGPAPPDFPEDASDDDQQQLEEVRRAIDALHGAFGTAGPLPTHATARQPQQLGDFRIIREIGRGGMGVVYEAEQLSMGRRVALKILPLATLIDPRALMRFQNEVRAAGALDHPHIVPVYAVGEERGVHYFAMQLVRGQSLTRVIEQLRLRELQRGAGSIAAAVHDSAALASGANGGTDRTTISPSADPLQQASTLAARGDETPAEHKPRYREYCRSVAELGVQAAEALYDAHEHGIVHRDIKPSNLLVDSTGRLWVTDFGLARIEADARLTQSKDWVGTLRYMAPEQALGHKSRVDHRVDIYALGVTLYELFALQPARAGDNREETLTVQKPRCTTGFLACLRRSEAVTANHPRDRTYGGIYRRAS